MINSAGRILTKQFFRFTQIVSTTKTISIFDRQPPAAAALSAEILFRNEQARIRGRGDCEGCAA